jgi:PAS domain S-box-containing protein
VPFIPSALYHFTVVLDRNYRRLKLYVLTVWLVSLGFAVLNAGTGALHDKMYLYWWGYYPGRGWLKVPFITFFAIVMFVILRQYWKDCHDMTREATFRNRARQLMIGFGIASMGSVDYIASFGIPFYPFGYLPVLIAFIIISRTIIRYRLVDITPAFAADYILNTITDALIVLDRDGLIRVVNHAACKLFESAEEELIGRPLGTVLSEDLMAGPFAELKRFGKIIDYEIEYHSREGERHSISLSATVMKVATENAVVCVFRDITERKKMEEALAESEQRYRRLIELLPYLICIHSEGRIVYLNPAGEKMIGFTHKDQYMGKSVIDFVHPESRKTVMSRIKKMMKTGEPSPLIVEKLIRADGQVIEAEVTASLFIYKGKKAIQVIARDISESKRAERALIESEERYRRLVEYSPEAIYVHCEGRFVYSNKAGLKLLGARNADELIGKHILDIVHPDYHGIVKKRVHIMTDKFKSVPLIEEKFIRLDGSVVDVEVVAIPFIYQGKPAVQVVALDITSRKRLEVERLRAQKIESIGILAGGLAHDFNNLLTGILGNISLVMEFTDPKDRIYRFLEMAEKASLQAKNLTLQLLTFSKGGMPIKRSESIRDIIVDSSDFALSGSMTRCKISIQDDIWPVEVDEGQMRQVFNNILINADQAMPDGGTIKINATNTLISDGAGLPLKAGRYVKISVQDEGTGIPEDLLSKIFDPYVTTKREGSGLGLYTAYSIIKKHDGLITVETEIGTGTTFYIYLPASEKVEVEERRDEEAPPKGSGRILVMDDDDLVRKVAYNILVNLGYDVEVACDGKEAIEMFRKAKEEGSSYDVVIMDLTVPGGMGGKDVIIELRKLDPDLKAIVSSGYSDDPIMSDYREYGFQGAIVKPYNIKELASKLRMVMNDEI